MSGIAHRRTQGSISDVATLKMTVKALGFIGAHGMHFVRLLARFHGL